MHARSPIDRRIDQAGGAPLEDYRGSLVSGPSHCSICGTWPAERTTKGLRCHLCKCRDICADNPVPLPESRECLKDLAIIGVPGAALKLAASESKGPTEATDIEIGTTTSGKVVVTMVGGGYKRIDIAWAMRLRDRLDEVIKQATSWNERPQD